MNNVISIKENVIIIPEVFTTKDLAKWLNRPHNIVVKRMVKEIEKGNNNRKKIHFIKKDDYYEMDWKCLFVYGAIFNRCKNFKKISRNLIEQHLSNPLSDLIMEKMLENNFDFKKEIVMTEQEKKDIDSYYANRGKIIQFKK